MAIMLLWIKVILSSVANERLVTSYSHSFLGILREINLCDPNYIKLL